MNCVPSKKSSGRMPAIFLTFRKRWHAEIYLARLEPKRCESNWDGGTKSWADCPKMKSLPRIGASNELEIVVEQKHVIDFATGGMPAVLSTPILIGLLERTARELLAPLLDADERTV